MMRASLFWLTLVLAMVAGTWWGGWWAVPVVAALFARLDPAPRAAVRAAGAAAVAWLGVIAYDAWVGPGMQFLAIMGQLIPVRQAGFVLLTVAFGAELAWAAARVVTPITPMPDRPKPPPPRLATEL
jgi:hypothetical protein